MASPTKQTMGLDPKYPPKVVGIIMITLLPVAFLATAALQQLRLVERWVVPLLRSYWPRKDIPFLMMGLMFMWAYVITASLSVMAQAAGQPGGYDNQDPRRNRHKVQSALGRVVAAHQVAIESVPAFFGALILASATKVGLEYRISFSVIYSVLRILHTPLYVLNLDIARTIAHVMSISCCMWLFAFACIPGFETEIYSIVVDVVDIRQGVSDEFWTSD